MSYRFWYRVGRATINSYAQLMFQTDVAWKAQLPNGPKIVAPNHPSTIDPALLTLLLPEHTSILIHETLFKVRVLGEYLDRAGHVPVMTGNGRAAFDQAIDLIRAGRPVAIFPEGAISPLNGGFHRPHTGVARLALATGAPVVPVGIGLRRDLLRLVETQVDGEPEVGTWYLRGPYAMTVGKPIRLTGDIEDRAHVRSATDRIMQNIAQLARESEQRVQGMALQPGIAGRLARRSVRPISARPWRYRF
jgi:1-acyl-sn-glycerol-3-phosphate acyltransferase